MTYWPTGLGSTLGDEVVTCRPLITSGSVWFVHYGTGDDTNQGEDPKDPLKTLGQAVTYAQDDDIIMLMDGHEETVTVAIDMSKPGVSIVGAGSSGGIPTAILTMGIATSGYMITMNDEGQTIGNVRFAMGASGGSGLISVGDSGCEIRGCYFSIDSTVTGGAVDVGGVPDFRCDGCTFLAAGTSLATRPQTGLVLYPNTDYARIVDCVFDGGTNGFVLYGLFELSSSLGVQVMRCSLLRGADISMSDTATGYVSASTSSGAAMVYWPVP